MAQLFRVTNHRDVTDSWTFTFLLPSTIVSPNAPNDVISRELLYAGNRWRVHVSRRDGNHLIPSLELLNCGDGLSCTLDYGFTLINQDSYTQNERFFEKQREFNDSRPRHGARTFIHVDDLTKRRGFFGAKHDLILELTMRSAATVVKTHLRLSLVGMVVPCMFTRGNYFFQPPDKSTAVDTTAILFATELKNGASYFARTWIPPKSIPR